MFAGHDVIPLSSARGRPLQLSSAVSGLLAPSSAGSMTVEARMEGEDGKKNK